MYLDKYELILLHKLGKSLLLFNEDLYSWPVTTWTHFLFITSYIFYQEQNIIYQNMNSEQYKTNEQNRNNLTQSWILGKTKIMTKLKKIRYDKETLWSPKTLAQMFYHQSFSRKKWEEPPDEARPSPTHLEGYTNTNF